MKMYKVLKEKKVFKDNLIVEEGEISYQKNPTFKRLRVNKGDAAAVLLINTESNTVILVKQFRYAILSKTKSMILEIAAGVIDKGEKPKAAAMREVEEETGYKIRSKNIKLLTTCFTTPGYSSERIHIYYATVTNSDKKYKGGGLKTENERIEIIEIPITKFKSHIKNNKIEDAKTCIAGLYMTSFLGF